MKKIFAGLVIVLGLFAVGVIGAHAEDTYSRVDYYGTGQDDYNGVWGSSWFCQSVTASKSYTLSKVNVMLFRVGSPGTLIMQLFSADGAGKPTGSALSSGTINGNDITATSAGTWYEINMSAYALSSGTQYVLLAKAPDASTGNYVSWCDDGAGATYAGGNMFYSQNSGSTWITYAGADMMFETYEVIVTPTPTPTPTPPPVDYYVTGQDDYNGVGGSSWFCQSVTASKSYTLSKVNVMLFRVGSPGTLIMQLFLADGAGKPTGSALSSGTINGNDITATSAGTWYEINMSAYALSSGTQYVLLAKAPDASTGNYVSWCDDGAGATYAGGNMFYSQNSGSTWTTYAGADMMFEMYEAIATPTPTPTPTETPTLTPTQTPTPTNTPDIVPPAAPVVSNVRYDMSGGINEICGTASSDTAAVDVYDGEGLIGTAGPTPPPNPAWCVTLTTPLAAGPHSISAKAKDAAGNRSPSSILNAVRFQNAMNAYKETGVTHAVSATSLRIEKTGSYDFKIAVNATAPVTVKAWLHYNTEYGPAEKPKITLSGPGIPGTETGQCAAATESALTDWQQLTVTGTPGAKGILTLRAETFSMADGAAAWVDDISVAQ